MNDFDSRVAAGREMERAGQYEEAIAHFRRLLDEYPNDPRAHFEYGGAFDSAGHEAEAIPHYRRAMELGLFGDYLPQAYLQLGSSLRNIGLHGEAVAVLDEGCRRFPNQPSLRVFRAFALESAGRSQEALTDLLELIIDQVQTPDMKNYARAIRYYTDERAR